MFNTQEDFVKGEALGFENAINGVGLPAIAEPDQFDLGYIAGNKKGHLWLVAFELGVLASYENYDEERLAYTEIFNDAYDQGTAFDVFDGKKPKRRAKNRGFIAGYDQGVEAAYSGELEVASKRGWVPLVTEVMAAPLDRVAYIELYQKGFTKGFVAGYDGTMEDIDDYHCGCSGDDI